MALMSLSSRLPDDFAPSPLHAALIDTPGPAPTDLMQSNPTLCEFDYPHITLPLLGPKTWAYAPEATGTLAARTHLADYLRACGQVLSPSDIVLTASTSEAYSSLFKLLCDPGMSVATGVPSYPLVPHLAQLDGVEVLHFRWAETESGWSLDWPGVQSVLNQGVRALVLVQPNSPLGTCLGPKDLQQLSSLCTQAGAVLIIDAVFDAYRPEPLLTQLPDALLSQGATIVLGGLSKAGGMPQLKLGWMLLYGDAKQKAQLHQGLDWIADAYLSVATPIQVALPELLAHLGPMQKQIRARIAANSRALQAHLADVPELSVKPYYGGWYAVLQGPDDADEEHVVRLLRREARVLVHPGYFYDFDRAGLWVLSLIVPVDAFTAALKRMAPVLGAGSWRGPRGLRR